MTTSVVFTFIGEDKPGLLEHISNTVSSNGGNWLESRMSQLAGQFAGITRVSISNDKVPALKSALESLSDQGLTIVVQAGLIADSEPSQQQQLTMIGNDRPGIVKEVSSALASRGINIGEMSSEITSAPMTAEPLFEATATIQVPGNTDLDELAETLENIGNELTIEINLEN